MLLREDAGPPSARAPQFLDFSASFFTPMARDGFATNGSGLKLADLIHKDGVSIAPSRVPRVAAFSRQSS